MSEKKVEFDELEKIFDYYHDGYQCAQVLLLYALEAQGIDNPDLVRAMGGLNRGMSNYRSVCGSLSGGLCLLSYFAGKGSAEETAAAVRCAWIFWKTICLSGRESVRF